MFSRFFLQLLLIFPAAYLGGRLSRKLGQPAVVGEMAAGILLGPSFFGFLWPAVYPLIFPADSLGLLRGLSSAGICLFMFLTGLEMDFNQMKRNARPAFLVSHAGILLPFLLAALAAGPLFGFAGSPAVSFSVFTLFLGVSMSITAFPVLARILQEKKLLHSELGTLALTAASMGDFTAWIIFTQVVSTAKAPSSFEVLGVHAYFAAFLAGVILPFSEKSKSRIIGRVKFFSSVFLLPLFFAITGIRTAIGTLKDPAALAVCLLVIGIATAGKFGGTFISARMLKLEWRQAASLGALMNARGLMELIVLNVAYEMKIFSPALFTMLVIMALVTTFMAGPLVSAFEKPSQNPSL